MNDFLAFLSENEFAQGGLFLGIFGAMAVYLRRLPGQVWTWTVHRLSWTVVIRNDDDLFKWALDIIGRNGVWARSWRATHTVENDEWKMVKSPAQWLSWFRYQGRRFLLWRNEDESANTNSLTTRETLTLRTMRWNRKVMDSLLEEAVAFGSPNSNKNSIHMLHYNVWDRFKDVELRPLTSVILPKGMVESMGDDLRDFLDGRQRYQELGVPYHRGYLFSGPPGNGKTSLIAGLAREFGLSLYVLHLDGLDDQRLLRAISLMATRSLLVLEDVDCVIPDRDKNSGGNAASRVTLSGLLNAIDGIATPDGQIVVMTTNCLEQLDLALMRPGRVDVSIEIARPNEDQRRRMYLRFFPGDVSGSEGFARDVDGLSMAEIQAKLREPRGERFLELVEDV